MSARSKDDSLTAINRALLGALVFSTPAYAAIEEVVVTAQKRAQDEQTTPLSITALGGQEISAANITTLGDVANATPGFSIDVFPRSQPRPFIRGIGSSNTGSAADPSVAVYVDEVYQVRPGFVRFDNYDLAQIEVLKGPQGTLWGKNVVGGLIHFITRKPEDSFDAGVELTGGNYGWASASGHINFPLTDTWASRLVLQRNVNSGFARNLQTGSDLFDQDSWSARLHNLFTLSDATKLRVSGYWVDEDNAGSSRNTYDGFVTGLSRDADGDVQRTTGEFDGYEDREIYGVDVALESTTGLGDITLVASHRRLKYDFSEDLDGSNYGDTLDDAVRLIQEGADPTTALLTGNGSVIQPQRGAFEDTEATSVELRLSKDFGSESLWSIGAYYESVDAQQLTFTSALHGSCFWAESSPYGDLGAALIDGIWGFLGIPFGTADACGVFPQLGVGPGDAVLDEFYQQDNETTSYAVFGEIVWALGPQTNLTTGVRWSYDEKQYTIGATTNLAGITLDDPYDPINVEDDWSQPTWRLVLDHSFSDTVFAYASVSSGYKAGGFQDNPTNADSAAIGFDPETVVNYELGLKSEWLDRSLRFNAALFFMDYTDLQVRQIDELRSFTDNAGEAEIRGLELDVLYAPIDPLSLYLKYAYLDTEFTKFVIVEDGEVISDFTGNRLSRTPEHAVTVGGSWTVFQPFEAGGDLIFATDYSWRDDRFEDSNNEPPEIIPAYGLLNGRISYETERWSATAWARNINDEEYATHTAQFAVENYVTFGPPQQYGLTFRYTF